MKLELEEIRAVFFRCNECRTAVSFPRIRWVRLPERCPNCGAAWMQEPTTELTFSEEIAIRAFQAANAFRDALQALIAVARTAGFTIGLETEDRSESVPGNSPHAKSGKPQKKLNSGKIKTAG
jgi:predicted nucleic acid binding AN1-type Zn finger protein